MPHVPQLPPDVLRMICVELGNQLDFDTLFSCALTSKEFAIHALIHMYRRHTLSRAFSGDGQVNQVTTYTSRSTELPRPNEQSRTVAKWALLWKSLIKSCLGSTAYPYCLCIKALELRNLAELLDDELFKETCSQFFFDETISSFLEESNAAVTIANCSERSTTGIQHSLHFRVTQVQHAVGEAITKFASEVAFEDGTIVAIEELSGRISNTALQIWARRLPKLKQLTLRFSSELDARVASVIASNCPSFDSLTCFTTTLSLPGLNGLHLLDERIDHSVGAFFSGLQQDSLRSFVVLGSSDMGHKTLLGLSYHAQSLQALKLAGSSDTVIRNLYLLKYCTALKHLEIGVANEMLDLNEIDTYVFLELIAWLGNCTAMKDLYITNFMNPFAIVKKMCVNKDIHLRSLDFSLCRLTGDSSLYEALAFQTSLESLRIQARVDGADDRDCEALVNSVIQLKKLTHLNLSGTFHFFTQPLIKKLTANLQNLEELWFDGSTVDDTIWDGLATLRNLKILHIYAMSIFTVQGTMNFISSLRPSNTGFLLSIQSQQRSSYLRARERGAIRKHLVSTVNGKLHYRIFRNFNDPGSDSEGLSDEEAAG